jgi:hypothetical protein
MEGRRRGHYDADYQMFLKESGLLTFDQKQAGAAREKTFYRTQEGQDTDVSRIDEILTQSSFATKPGAKFHTIATIQSNTDHKILVAEVLYTSLGQLPLPVVEEHNHGSKTVLITPMSAESKQSLKAALDNGFTHDLQSLYQDLREEIENNVEPYWENIDEHGLTQSPKWADRQTLQETVNALGDRISDILSRGHQVAFQVCPTKEKGKPEVQHYQNRTTARLRRKYLRLQKRLRKFDMGGNS